MAANQKSTAIEEIEGLLRDARFARLGTLDTITGHPFVSLVAIARLGSGDPLTLISSLARHTANLMANANASLLLEERGPKSGYLLTRPRVTISGSLIQIEKADGREPFLAIHGDAREYVDFDDFSFWRMKIKEAYLVAGFGEIHTIPGDQLGR